MWSTCVVRRQVAQKRPLPVFQFYKIAMQDKFDVNNPRMWKSICLSCNKS